MHHHQIGVLVRNITTALALGLDLEREDGVVIEDVIPGSPADTAGLMPGDVVLSVDGKEVQNIRQFTLVLYSFAVGERAKLGIQRGKERISSRVLVTERQDVQGHLADLVTKEQTKIPQLGILALTVDEKLLVMLPPLRNPFGVVVAGKESEGAYFGDELLPGDVIYSVNGSPVDSVDSLRSALDGFNKSNASGVFTTSCLKQTNEQLRIPQRLASASRTSHKDLVVHCESSGVPLRASVFLTCSDG